MADENTTGSEQTTETVAPTVEIVETPEMDSSTSTTETKPEAEQETLLTAKAPEPKVEEPAKEQTDEEKAAAEEHAKLFGAPEGDYEIAGLPEGTVIDTDALAVATPIFKKLGLSNEGASEIVSAYATQILPKVADQVVDGLQRDIAAQHTTWANEAIEMVKTDETFGGKPLTEVQQVAAKAIDRFAGPEFREFLNTTGLGNNPAMMKFAYLAGSAISEDTTFERGGTAAKPKSVTEKFYPKD